MFYLLLADTQSAPTTCQWYSISAGKKIQNIEKKDNLKKIRKEASKQERNSILIINPLKVTFSHG